MALTGQEPTMEQQPVHVDQERQVLDKDLELLIEEVLIVLHQDVTGSQTASKT